MATKKMTPSQYAQHQGVSRQYISKLLKLGIFALEGGLIDPVKADKLIEQSRPPSTMGNVTFAEAQTRKAVALAELRELELHCKRGLLIDKEKAMNAWRQVLLTVRNRFLGLPAKLAPLVYSAKSPAEAFVTLKKEIHEILDELSEDKHDKVRTKKVRKLK